MTTAGCPAVVAGPGSLRLGQRCGRPATYGEWCGHHDPVRLERQRVRLRVAAAHAADPGLAVDRARDLEKATDPLPEDEP